MSYHTPESSFSNQSWSSSEMAPTIRTQFYNKYGLPNPLIYTVPPPNSRDQYYNLEKVKVTKKFECITCDKSFFSHGQYKKHIDEHIECPFPECKLSAHIKIIDQHISNQHMLVNVQDIQVDAETWKAERRKRAVTVEKSKIRQAIKAEKEKLKLEKKNLLKKPYKDNQSKIKEGEFKVGLNYPKKSLYQLSKEKHNKVKSNYQQSEEQNGEERKTFNNKKREWKPRHERDEGEFNPTKKEWKPRHERGEFNPTKKEWKPRHERGEFNPTKKEWKPRHERVEFVVDLYDSDSEIKRGVPKFKGTKAYYESTGELSLFGFKNNDRDIDEGAANISDEEEWSVSPLQSDCKEIKLQNALGSLIGAYNSDSESGLETRNDQTKALKVNNNAPTSTNHSIKTSEKVDCPPESFSSLKRKRKHFRGNKRKFNGSNGQTEDNLKNNGCRLKPQPHKPAKRRRPTLLQKLLEPAITRERNMISQCIRYIVNNNFFKGNPPNNDQPNVQRDFDNAEENSPINDIPKVQCDASNEVEHSMNIPKVQGDASNEVEHSMINDTSQGKCLVNNIEKNAFIEDQSVQLVL